MLFWLLLGLDVLAASVAGYFFVLGLSDGSVSSFNIGEWTVLLATLAAIIAGGVALHRTGYVKSGNLVLAVLATPALLYAAFMVIVIMSGARWN